MRIALAFNAAALAMILSGCNLSPNRDGDSDSKIPENAYLLDTYPIPHQVREGYMVGTIASSDEICSVLNHDYFLNFEDGPGQNGSLPNWEFEYTLETGEKSHAGNDWLYNHIEPLRRMNIAFAQSRGSQDTNFRVRWRPTGRSFPIIKENLEGCLRRIYQTDKVRFSRIEPFLFIHSYHHNQPFRERGSPNVMPEVPCFERAFVTRERMNQNGEFEQYQTTPEGRLGCLNFAQHDTAFGTFEYLRKGKGINGGWWGDTFMILLTLREGNKVLKNMLDRAVLDARVSSGHE